MTLRHPHHLAASRGRPPSTYPSRRPRGRSRAGRARASPSCCSARRCSTCGASAPPGTPTSSTRPPCRRARRAGRRCSSAPWTPATRSRSTSRRSSCGRWRSRRGSSASTAGACSCRRRSRASPRSRCSRAAVRRVAGHAAGLAAGALLAITPVAVADVPVRQPRRHADAAAHGVRLRTVRALRVASRGQWWLALAGTLVGLGFITKMGQALLVVPALAIAYLCAAPVGLGRRVRDVLGAGVAMVVGGGLVDRRRRALARVRPAVHRRLDDEQRARARLRLQRPRPAVRRHRQRRRWRRGRCLLRRLAGADPALQLVVRHGDGDLLAAARRRCSRSSPGCG